MSSTEIFLLIAGFTAGGIIFWWLANRNKSRGELPNNVFADLERHMTDRLDKVSNQLDLRLRENIRAMNESKSFLADRVNNTERTVRAVSTSLGKLEEATSALKLNTDEIMSFQQLLKSPKVRGGFGEVLLGNLLADVLPTDRYQLQYTMRASGEIADAIIELQDDQIVAIDAKFPLANYEAYVREKDPARKQTMRSALTRDVKKHITDISKKYISPRDRTLDYAFMYIPAEAVYYETMLQGTEDNSLWSYCLTHKIVPVSPNSFLAYLHTVLVGLRGMKIEKQAKEILNHLGQVRRDFKKFSDDFLAIGSHLNHAKNRYDDSSRRLDKFTNRLEQIETDTSPTLPQPEEE
ncbi:MAG: DNA recombination protein RmuC [bacterium]|nr:DNA recombination protein RmuC [bacterium]